MNCNGHAMIASVIHIKRFCDEVLSIRINFNFIDEEISNVIFKVIARSTYLDLQQDRLAASQRDHLELVDNLAD